MVLIFCEQSSENFSDVDGVSVIASVTASRSTIISLSALLTARDAIDMRTLDIGKKDIYIFASFRGL